MMIVEGGVDLFNAMAYGKPTQRDISFFEQARQNIMSSSWGQTAQQFYQNVKSGFDNFDLDKINNYVNLAVKRIAGIWELDIIKPLVTLEEMQFANDKMIRWIMANPNVRDFYHRGACEGYGEKYVDAQPGKVKEEHLDWRMVMHGMEQYDKDEEVNVWTTYDNLTDAPEYDVNTLDMSDKLDILTTWSFMDAEFAKMGEDPTSQYSAML